MNSKIDRDQFIRMRKRGLSKAEISRRLECSSKQLGRIEKELTEKGFEFPEPVRIDEEIETITQRVLLKMGVTSSEVGRVTGVSRQAIYKKFAEC